MKDAKTQLTACAAVLVLAICAGTSHARTPDRQAAISDRADQLLGPASKPNTAPPEVAPVVNDGEAYHRAPDESQDPAELRTTQALNDEVVSRNQLIANQERADQAAFETERVKYEAAAAQSLRDRLAYEESVRQAEIDAEAAQRQWERDNARWEADVRACEAGNRARCAPPR